VRCFILPIGLLLLLSSVVGCTYNFERPGANPCRGSGGYYNGYYNKDVAILYKRPSSKLFCWVEPDGWHCLRK
jgi:hypothetical protein